MEKRTEPVIRNIFIIGAKSIGQYGGYESFVDNLTQLHQKIPDLQYRILTKGNSGKNPDSCSSVVHGAEVVRINVPDIGHLQALVYDIRAWKYCLEYIRKNRIESPVIYVLACRRWLPFKRLVKEAHRLGGTVFVNPDGHEWQRTKWPAIVRLYLKLCEKAMIPSADLVVCDSLCIEKYISEAYSTCRPVTKYIAYGADPAPSLLENSSREFTHWLKENNVSAQGYFMCCGRFVPENNFEVIIREFMKSRCEKKLVIITTENRRLMKKLQRKLHFENDPRIHFAGPVYEKELLKKIRENAFANIHGHMVGGTNPNLLESLASTSVNLVYDVCFNREVAEDAALYWSLEEGNLAGLIDRAENLIPETRNAMEQKGKNRIYSAYSWNKISGQYEELFRNS